jgi:hypothetical protein
LPLGYRSAKDYDHNWTIDWSNLIAKQLSPLLLSDGSLVKDDVKWEDGLGLSWMNGQRKK